MKKDWTMPVVETVDLSETGFGPSNPDLADSEKTAVQKHGKSGWIQEYGEGSM